MASKRKKLAVSLFAGVGGLDLGVAAAGFEVALAIVADSQTAAQYQANFPGHEAKEADITEKARESESPCVLTRG